MKELIKTLKSRLSMKREQNLFLDKVNRKVVNLYVDCYGVKWMAKSKFGYRIRIKLESYE